MPIHRPTRARRFTPAFLLPLLLLLSGCFSAELSFVLHEDGTVDYTMAAAEHTDEAEAPDCSDPEASIGIPDGATVAAESFEDAQGYPGCRLMVSGMPIEEFGDDMPMTITREGDVFTVTYETDPAYEQVPTADLEDIDIVVSVTFPGEVTDAGGGEVDGSTVTWAGADLVRQGFSATGEAASGGGVPWMPIGIVGGLVVVGGLAAAIALSRRRGTPSADGGSTGSGQASPPPATPGHDPSGPSGPGASEVQR